MMRIADRERGSASLEAVVVTPVLLILLGLVVFGGRVAMAHQAVQAAAAEAARSASIARTQGAAGASATAGAQAALENQGVECLSRSVQVNTSGFASPAGVPASVSATVSCSVDLDLALPGMPSSMRITKTATSPLDTYRER